MNETTKPSTPHASTWPPLQVAARRAGGSRTTKSVARTRPTSSLRIAASWRRASGRRWIAMSLIAHIALPSWSIAIAGSVSVSNSPASAGEGLWRVWGRRWRGADLAEVDREDRDARAGVVPQRAQDRAVAAQGDAQVHVAVSAPATTSCARRACLSSRRPDDRDPSLGRRPAACTRVGVSRRRWVKTVTFTRPFPPGAAARPSGAPARRQPGARTSHGCPSGPAAGGREAETA